MTLQLSGDISLDDIQFEMGGVTPIGIDEYYGMTSEIPNSGQISFSDFYGKELSNYFALYLSNGNNSTWISDISIGADNTIFTIGIDYITNNDIIYQLSDRGKILSQFKLNVSRSNDYLRYIIYRSDLNYLYIISKSSDNYLSFLTINLTNNLVSSAKTNVLFSGVSPSSGIVIDSSAANFYIIVNSTFLKVATSGFAIAWQKVFTSMTPISFTIDSSNNVYLLHINASFNLIVSKFNSAGTAQWHRLINGTAFTTTGSIKCDLVTSDLYISCYYRHATNNPTSSIVNLKFNTSGTLQWQRKFTINNVTLFTPPINNLMDIDSSNNLYTLSYVLPSGTSYEENIIITKYNSSGTFQWARRLWFINPDGSNGLMLHSIKCIGSNFYIYGKNGFAETGSSGERQFILKLPTDGTLTGIYGIYEYYTYDQIIGTTPTFTSSTTTPTITAGTITTSATTITKSTLDYPSIYKRQYIDKTLRYFSIDFQLTYANTIGQYFTGFTSNSTDAIYAGLNEYSIIRINHFGTVDLIKLFDGYSIEIYNPVVIIDSDNNFNIFSSGSGTILQYSNNFASYNWGKTFESRDFLSATTYYLNKNIYLLTSEKSIIKLSSTGTFQWERTLSTIVFSYFRSVAIDSLENIYVLGTESNGIVIVKYNSSGTLQWQRRLSGANIETAQQIGIDFSDNIYITGISTSVNPGVRTILLFKYNSAGTLQWQKSLAASTFTISSSSTVCLYVRPNGDIFILIEGPYSNLYILKFNNSGTLQFQNRWNSTELNTVFQGLSLLNFNYDYLFIGFLAFVLQWRTKILKLPIDGSTGTFDGSETYVTSNEFTVSTSTLTGSTPTLTSTTTTPAYTTMSSTTGALTDVSPIEYSVFNRYYLS